MVYFVLVRLLQRVQQFVPSSLLSTHYVPNVSLNISFKIWPTSESLRLSKNQHSAVEKTVRGFTKSD